MKKSPNGIARITPSAHGWLLHENGSSRPLPTLDEAAEAVASHARLHLSIPCHMALIERLVLPATSEEELAGMAHLQLEKTLPYPVEEASSAVVVVERMESSSAILSIAVNTEALSKLCNPLRSQHRTLEKITLFAQHFASACPAGETVLAIWEEHEHLAFGIFEDQKLAWAHTLPSGDSLKIAEDLPPLLLGAQMEGAPTAFKRILIATECSAASEALGAAFQCPVEVLETDPPALPAAADLLPSQWGDELKKAERFDALRHKFTLAAIGYLALVAAGFLYLAIVKRQVQQLDAQIADLQPQLIDTQAKQKRWKALAPATDPNRYAIEVLRLAWENRPGQDAHVTVFDFAPTQFKVEGEAPNAGVAVEYAEKLLKNTDLAGFKIHSGQPRILPDGRAQFSIFGER